MKNQFGVTPNSSKGDQAASEEATAGRGTSCGPLGREPAVPGLKPGATSLYPCLVPRVMVEICAARPIHAAVIDGITAMSGAKLLMEGVKLADPGLAIVGFKSVSIDAVGTALIDYAKPRAPKGEPSFLHPENHLLLAEEAGLAMAGVGRIKIVGLPRQKARRPHPELSGT